METKDYIVDENGCVKKPETWNAVAESYRIELDSADYQLANAIENLLIQNGLKQGDSLIEMGCGSGHLSACLAQRGYKVTLVDFSPVALEKAKLTFEHYGINGKFIQGNLFHLDQQIERHDYAWNSGVMEHFEDKELVTLMRNISRYAAKGVLYLMPNSTSIAYLLMRARLMSSDEWIYGQEYLRNDYDIILKDLGYGCVKKSYVSTADISAYQMWQAEKKQGNISELYKSLAEEYMLPDHEGYLVAYFASNQEMPESHTTDYSGTCIQDTRLFDLVTQKIGYTEAKKQISVLTKKIEDLEKLLAEKEVQLTVYEQQLGNCNSQLVEYETAIHNEKAKSQGYEKTLLDCKIKIAEHENRTVNYKSIIESHEKTISEKEVASADYEKRITDYEKRITDYDNTLLQMTSSVQYAQEVLTQKEEYVRQAIELCNHFATGKLMQLNHLLFRIKAQILKGSKEDRKLFRTWLRGRIKKTNRDIGDGVKYNPWMFVNQILLEANACKYTGIQFANTQLTLSQSPNTVCTASVSPSLPSTAIEALSEKYTKHDVIILSVIDYDFRHQRPQHFATRFADNGHRVFYVNANFIRPDSVIRKSANLYLVDFECKDYNAIYAMDGKSNLNWMKEKFSTLINSWAIRDAVVVVDYPNWVYGAEYIRNQFGFKIATDYMDDYTGFLGTAEDFLKDNCIKLLQDSDIVVASSQFLCDVACKYTDSGKITIIRNGTEVKHFYQAVHMEREKERKVIGYYGAVAHWFAWEKICYLAKTMPECDIVIVGAVTEHREKLEKYSNIKLLGEKPYSELPKYLADFDVCLIPFDTSTDLIKATNPVKFYEYLSAGKKVVATEIPELMPYRDEYVYMSNEDMQFAEYVKLCLYGEDNLKGKEECIAFARDNDWQSRFEYFAAACQKQVPLVSIIVLTYNNLELNKNCIDSILDQTAYANYELIIVDNQSNDGTVEYLKNLQQLQLPNVKIILNDTNTGFAGGNNIGIRAAKGDYVLLLNNDTVITRGWLTSMVKHLENHSEYGMCNPVTNSIGNESKIVACYTNREELVHFAYTYTSEHMGEEYVDVDRLPLFATMIKREVIEKTGLLDENYKVGMFEDDDYTEQVLHAGYKIVIVEDAFIHHVNNASFKKLDDEKYKKIFDANKKIFETKWKKTWTMPKYRPGVDWDSNLHVSLETYK